MTKRRRRRYRSEASPNKKAVTVFVLCIFGTLLISLIVALIIGNALGNAAKKLDRTSHENEIFSYEGLDTSPINASLLSLEGQTTESALKKVDELSANSAISICLRKDSGAFLYSSDVAAGVIGSTGILDLEALVNALHKKNIHVSATFFVKSPSVAAGAGRDAAIEYEAALIDEAFDCGVDDIILTGLPSDTDGIAAASRLFAAIREKRSEKVILGASVTYKTMLSDSGAYALEKYSSFADIFAIDMSSCRAAGLSYASLANKLLFIFKAYPVRALIDCSGEADRLATVAELNSLGIYNIQLHKLSIYSGSTPAG